MNDEKLKIRHSRSLSTLKNKVWHILINATLFFLVSAQAQEVAKSVQNHMYTALTAKRNALVEQLEAKVKRYKELQVKEMVCM